MPNYKLIVAYDGSGYYGWQKNISGPSIEVALQKVLEQILQHPVKLQAASRTDRGVHALGQVVNFHTEKMPSLLSINSLLPEEIRALSLDQVEASFHPTLDAKSKTYSYRISTSPVQLPHDRMTCYHIWQPLDLDAMNQAAKHLIGTHDFKSFTCRKKDPHETTTRTLSSCVVETSPPHYLQITMTGNAFLYKMARTIAGTLIYVGLGKLKADDIPSILKSKSRPLSGVTAPAHGLTLVSIAF